MPVKLVKIAALPVAILLLLFFFAPCSGAGGIGTKRRASDTLTGRFLYEKNVSERLPIASTTKIMTALIVLEQADLSDTVEIRREYTLTEGSSMYLKEVKSIPSGSFCTV